MRIDVTKDNLVLPFNMLLDVEQSRVPFFAEVEEQTETIDGVDGEIQLSTRYASAYHELVMCAPDITRDEKNALLLDVDNFLALARTEIQELHYERLNRTYYVKYVGGADRDREYAGTIAFRIPLKAHDPKGYADNESSRSVTGICDNRGNQPAPARMEFKGAVTNPSVTVNGTVYQYTGTIAANTTLIVDTQKQTAVIRNSAGAETNVNTNWNGNFLTLQVGNVNNLSAITNATGKFTLYWRNRWA